MRVSLPILASASAACGCAIAPQLANAAAHPQNNRRLSIHASPTHIIAGDPVLIDGHLTGPDAAGRMITLYHRIAKRGPFTIIGRTTTSADGDYEFTRAQDVVNTNRSWYVVGPARSHSKTIHERVAAEVTLNPSASQGTTRHALTFTGQVTPGHQGSRVSLQVENGIDDTWQTIARARVGANSTYVISRAWRVAGERTVRVAFGGDTRNTAAASDPAVIVINQRQTPAFSITTTAPLLGVGQTATVSGVLDLPNTTTPEPGTEVGLYARAPRGGPFTLVQTVTTATDGGYAFIVGGPVNQLYQARAMTSPVRSSAIVFQGVQDAVSMTPSATSSTVDGTVTFSGAVNPAKAGHVVDLERLGRDGHWQVAATSTVTPSSTFSFDWTFGAAGSREFRAHVLGGAENVGGVSTPVTIAVSQPPLASLPTG